MKADVCLNLVSKLHIQAHECEKQMEMKVSSPWTREGIVFLPLACQLRTSDLPLQIQV